MFLNRSLVQANRETARDYIKHRLDSTALKTVLYLVKKHKAAKQELSPVKISSCICVKVFSAV